MKNLGAVVRYNRKSQNLTLAKLAKGICSVSYLSKIEKGHSTCSEEITEFLLNRLGVYEQLAIDQVTEVNRHNELHLWYSDMLKQDLPKVIASYPTIKESFSEINNIDLKKLFQLFEFRYYLLVNNYTKTRKIIDLLQSTISTFTPTEQYYFYKFSGLFEYTYGKPSKAKEHYIIALDLQKYCTTPSHMIEKEKADLFFLVALNEYKLFHYTLCINYVRKAVHYFHEQFWLKRCIEAYNLLGTALMQTEQYELAKKQLDFAIHAADELQDSAMKGISYLHLGNLYRREGKMEDALKCFSFSLEQHASDVEKVNAIITMIEFYETLQDEDNIKKWIQKGASYSRNLKKPNSSQLILTIYLLKSENRLREMEGLLTKKALPHFTAKEEYHHSYKFSTLLAYHFSKKKKYKQAYFYSTLASDFLLKMGKVIT